MGAPNLIHGLTLDVAWEGSAEAGEALADWLREALLPVLDEVLTQQDVPGPVRRVERLELDLGTVTREEAEGELPRRLQERLTQALRWTVQSDALAATGASTVQGPMVPEGPGEQLLSFLRSGRLPWSVAADREVAHEQLLRRLLSTPSAAAVLDRVVREEQMLTRLVRQYSPALLADVLAALHPGQVVPPAATEAEWRAALQGRSVVTPELAKFMAWRQHQLDLGEQALSLAELRQWLIWWLMHDASLVNQDCSLMLEAISAQCGQAPDPVQFMQMVLSTLRAGGQLDLEQLAQQSGMTAMDAITTLKSQAAIRNFVGQHAAEDKRLGNLNSAQLHQLVRAWIGGDTSVFLSAIEKRALQTADAHGYFRHILQNLLDGREIDLEALCGENAGALVQLGRGDIAPPAHRGKKADPAIEPPSDAHASGGRAPAEGGQRGPSPLPALLQQNLPQRLANAMLQADLSSLEIIWPEITRYHADVLLAAAQRYLRRPQERANLAARASTDMLIAMLKAIRPAAALLIAPVLSHAKACCAVLTDPLPEDEFRHRSLHFALDLALSTEHGGSLIDLIQALLPRHARPDDFRQIAHAWRAILPPTPALDSALFGAKYAQAIQEHLLAADDEDASPGLYAVLTEEVCQRYPDLLSAPLREQLTAALPSPPAAEIKKSGSRRQSAAKSAKAPSAETPAPAAKKRRQRKKGADKQSPAPPAAIAQAESTLAILLMCAGELGRPEQLAVELMLQRLLASGTALTGALETALSQPAAISRLVEMTPGAVLAQLLVRLQPQLAAQLPNVLRAIASQAGVANIPALQTGVMWQTIYQAAFVTADPVTPAEFIRALVRKTAGANAELPEAMPASGTATDIMRTLLQPLARAEERHTPVAQQEPQSQQGDANVRNAGMVIIATYAQRLFSILELTKDGNFVSEEGAQRAVHLLQYAITAKTSTPEYQLVLNKLLCGIHGGQPIARGIDITDKEKDTIEQMLNGVIAHWKALGKTSISGLRQTFLQREGQLYFEEDAWHLKIPAATFDMLLDRLPWSFAMIKFPWMEHPLHVTWR